MTAIVVGVLIAAAFYGLMRVPDSFWDGLRRGYEMSLMLFFGVVIFTIGIGVAALGVSIDGVLGAIVVAVAIGIMAIGVLMGWAGIQGSN